MPAAAELLVDGTPVVVSPELVLVDPSLAAALRVRAEAAAAREVHPPEPDDPPQQRALPRLSEYTYLDDEQTGSDARRRLVESAIAAEDALPTVRRRHLRRRVTLVLAGSAASAVALFVAELALTHPSLA